MSKPREFAHLIKNKFGSADNINTLSREFKITLFTVAIHFVLEGPLISEMQSIMPELECSLQIYKVYKRKYER